MRKAIAMLELIFSIVIMGIILMSAPMLISTATKSGYVTMQQEGINEAAAQVNMMLGQEWDENNTDDSYRAVILTTAAGDIDLAEEAVGGVNTGLRYGTPKTSYRRFVRDGTRPAASAIGPDGEGSDAVFDDVDDYEGSTVHLQFVTDPTDDNDEDYVETTTIDIARNVKFTSDTLSSGDYITSASIGYAPNIASAGTAAAAATNIKRIQVTLTSTSTADELQKTITLHAFTCNIGSYELEER